MMKIRAIALAAAAIASAPAAFAAPAVNPYDAGTVQIYMSGASALRAAVAGLVLNDVCGGSATNSSTTLYNVAEAGTGFSFNGNLWAITCRVTAAGGALVGLPGDTPVAFFKSDAGGSAQGVFPVYFGDARPFVDVADLSKCAQTTADRVYTSCSLTRNVRPMVGVSDVEPGLFTGINVPADPVDLDDDAYPSSGLSAGQQGELTIKPVVQTVFGIAVNTALYNDMFAKQGLAARKDFAGVACSTSSTDEPCVPSIGYAEARSLFAGTEANWRLLSANAAKLDTQVNICRRVAGSGTQAAANAHLMGLPCNAYGVSPATVDSSSSAAPEYISAFTGKTVSGKSLATYLVDNMGGGAGNGPMPSGSTFVFEGPGTGDVTNCLNAAEKAKGYAIGHVSRENVPASGANWKHVRLEGTFPSRDAAKSGRYDYFFESTVQWKTDYVSGLSAAQQTFIPKLAERMAKPDSLARLSSANQNGVAALPESYAGEFGVGSVNELTFGSRVTRAGNSCQPVTAVK
ncbi:hypothetical protein [Roseateles sp.]|uniref:hypothetical protein n=1 Tax=Roseateles sp. TaxID=1971397 RepID=UPI00391A63F7